MNLARSRASATLPQIFSDPRSPGRNIPKLQDGYNRKGLIAEDDKKKPAFVLFQKAYSQHWLTWTADDSGKKSSRFRHITGL
jgi:hypothetical protein